MTYASSTVIAAGTQVPVSATYSGDSNFETSSGSEQVTVGSLGSSQTSTTATSSTSITATGPTSTTESTTTSETTTSSETSTCAASDTGGAPDTSGDDAVAPRSAIPALFVDWKAIRYAAATTPPAPVPTPPPPKKVCAPILTQKQIDKQVDAAEAASYLTISPGRARNSRSKAPARHSPARVRLSRPSSPSKAARSL